MNRKLVIALLVAIGLSAGCSRPDATSVFLEQQGYTQVEITGWRPFMKDKNDFFSTGFRAKNQNGVWVTGAVSEGILKGKTIRFD